jgi:hypothetical protein
MVALFGWLKGVWLISVLCCGSKVGDIRFPLISRDHFCHTSCPIHCYGHNLNENILTPQNDSFEAIL